MVTTYVVNCACPKPCAVVLAAAIVNIVREKHACQITVQYVWPMDVMLTKLLCFMLGLLSLTCQLGHR